MLALSYWATPSAALLVEAAARDLSGRVTVVAANETGLGINADWYVERIEHAITLPGPLHRTTYHLSPVDPATYWILGTSTLGVDTVLAF